MLAAALPKCTTIKAVYLDWNPLPSRATAPVAAIEATPGGKDEGGEGKGEEEKGGDGGDGDGDGDGDSKAQAAAPASPADVYVASSACGMPCCAVSACVAARVTFLGCRFAELINNDSSFSYLSLRGNNLSEGAVHTARFCVTDTNAPPPHPLCVRAWQRRRYGGTRLRAAYEHHHRRPEPVQQQAGRLERGAAAGGLA